MKFANAHDYIESIILVGEEARNGSSKTARVYYQEYDCDNKMGNDGIKEGFAVERANRQKRRGSDITFRFPQSRPRREIEYYMM